MSNELSQKIQEYLKELIGHQTPEWYENAVNTILEICKSNSLYSDTKIHQCVSESMKVASESIINALDVCGLLNHQIKSSILEQAAKFRWYKDIDKGTDLIWRYSNSKSTVNIYYYDGYNNMIMITRIAYDKENDATHIPILAFEAVSVLTKRGQDPLTNNYQSI